MTRHRNGGLKKRCGCPRRTWAKCSHPWHFGYYHKGREHRCSLSQIARALGEEVPTSKTEAKELADRLRALIRAGNNPVSVSQEPDPMGRMTLRDVMLAYEREYVETPTRRESARRHMRSHLAILRDIAMPDAAGTVVRLADKPMDAVTGADVDAVRRIRRDAMSVPLHADPRRRPGLKDGEVGINRLLARLRHIYNWAIKKKYVEHTPYRRNGVVVVALETRAENGRSRRLGPGEEDRLLQNANPRMQAFIVAMLATGCRPGELLSLQWSQIRRDDTGRCLWMDLPVERTKTYQQRLLPIGQRLRSVLEMRETDPKGNPWPSSAYVFGNEVGEPVKSVKTAWKATCRRAGITGLHLNDLRHEFGCRLLESGSRLHDVRDFLGHANITTTSRYLQSSSYRLADALRRLEVATPEKFAHSSHKPSDQTTPPSAPDQKRPVL